MKTKILSGFILVVDSGSTYLWFFCKINVTAEKDLRKTILLH